MDIPRSLFVILALIVIDRSSSLAQDTAEQPPPKCSCPEMPSLDKAIADSSAVFTGRVVSIRKSALRQGQQEISFNPLRIFMGIAGSESSKEVIVYTPIDETSCSFSFQLNQDYLVFVRGNRAYMKIDRCGRTQQLDLAAEDAQELDKRFEEPATEP